ncbi:MAG: hypothetical protein ACK4SN_15040 [Bellilinea sp.]
MFAGGVARGPLKIAAGLSRFSFRQRQSSPLVEGFGGAAGL